eukprot:19596-Eustigmatos_ZCMA.PRE.1
MILSRPTVQLRVHATGNETAVLTRDKIAYTIPVLHVQHRSESELDEVSYAFSEASVADPSEEASIYFNGPGTAQ